MKIITWNINGYRSADKQGKIAELINEHNPDIICMQEIKMNNEIINNYGYHCYYNFASKKGYSGTLILTKEKPLKINNKLNLERFDNEGRFILLEYKNFFLINLYVPHGGRAKENHPYKFATINKILKLISELTKPVIICTDFNIAHEEIDLQRFKDNYHNNMFTKEERAKITELLSLGYVDSLRTITQETNIYSWWSNSFNARNRNMGWRIDYIFVSSKLANKIKEVNYLKNHLGSDHCPCILKIELQPNNNQ